MHKRKGVSAVFGIRSEMAKSRAMSFYYAILRIASKGASATRMAWVLWSMRDLWVAISQVVGIG